MSYLVNIRIDNHLMINTIMMNICYLNQGKRHVQHLQYEMAMLYVDVFYDIQQSIDKLGIYGICFS